MHTPDTYNTRWRPVNSRLDCRPVPTKQSFISFHPDGNQIHLISTRQPATDWQPGTDLISSHLVSFRELVHLILILTRLISSNSDQSHLSRRRRQSSNLLNTPLSPPQEGEEGGGPISQSPGASAFIHPFIGSFVRRTERREFFFFIRELSKVAGRGQTERRTDWATRLFCHFEESVATLCLRNPIYVTCELKGRRRRRGKDRDKKKEKN